MSRHSFFVEQAVYVLQQDLELGLLYMVLWKEAFFVDVILSESIMPNKAF